MNEGNEPTREDVLAWIALGARIAAATSTKQPSPAHSVWHLMHYTLDEKANAGPRFDQRRSVWALSLLDCLNGRYRDVRGTKTALMASLKIKDKREFADFIGRMGLSGEQVSSAKSKALKLIVDAICARYMLVPSDDGSTLVSIYG